MNSSQMSTLICEGAVTISRMNGCSPVGLAFPHYAEEWRKWKESVPHGVAIAAERLQYMSFDMALDISS